MDKYATIMDGKNHEVSAFYGVSNMDNQNEVSQEMDIARRALRLRKIIFANDLYENHILNKKSISKVEKTSELSISADGKADSWQQVMDDWEDWSDWGKY